MLLFGWQTEDGGGHSGGDTVGTQWRCLLLLQQDQRRVRVDPQVFAAGFAVISQVGRPVPLGEELQQLDGDRRHMNALRLTGTLPGFGEIQSSLKQRWHKQH